MLDVTKIIETIRKGGGVSSSDAEELCALCVELLIEEGNVEMVDTPLVICGDIHGQLHDLLTLFDVAGGGPPPNHRYLFLGDYVDRGLFSVETLLLLVAYKVAYRDCVYLLRGNHESRQITSVYGFYDECLRKYPETGAVLWRHCCEMFDYLPLGALIGGSVFAVHGGLSPAVVELNSLKSLDRKQEVPHDGPMCDLLWSDPDSSLDSNRGDNGDNGDNGDLSHVEIKGDMSETGWALSPRGAGYLFGKAPVRQFLHVNGLSLIARAHQLVMEGYKEQFEGAVVTVWSAPNYCYRCGNVASVLSLDDALNRVYTTFESADPQEDGLNRGRDACPPQADYFL